MLIWLSQLSGPLHPYFYVLHYVTVRAAIALMMTCSLTLWSIPRWMRWMKQRQWAQVIYEDSPESHQEKQGTPTLGGVMIVLNVLLVTLLTASWDNHYIGPILLLLLGFALIGGLDDGLKIQKNNNKGLSARTKFLLQCIISCVFAAVLFYYASTPEETALFIPFFKSIQWPLGLWFIPFAMLVTVSSSNAVNLSDGLDGLACGMMVIILGALMLLTYLAGHHGFAHYLHLPYLPGASELSVFSASLLGACLGFLWYNTYPAELFMGDVGALSLGATLGGIALIIHQECAFIVMSGVFILETISVILQVASFKIRKKRIFAMAPLHHHFELQGWQEPKIMARFWIITLLLTLLALSTLKLR
jgi:phospho-N-acetylmuramoyl-pentapeptide-transferase